MALATESTPYSKLKALTGLAFFLGVANPMASCLCTPAITVFGSMTRLQIIQKSPQRLRTAKKLHKLATTKALQFSNHATCLG